MVNPSPYGQPSDLDWLLTNFAKQVPHVRSALVASADGLKKYVHGLDPDGADKLAAIASGLCSLARSSSVTFGGSPVVRQVIAELDDTLLFVSSAGSGALLAVIASSEADAGVIGYEMAQLVRRVPSYLATPPRFEPAPPGSTVR
ncbi:roadblock/LC7 domain-containing protein [Streptomyces sp. RB6PN25]|uniref:Roadblock/LC7 domain-containing protein n=1 Tax=Streptomyces humicola TaxID=2953240 RepID=A0ABT1PNB8_9ACTN|nr:roadblock/LC7 domain-containing protein [Streptomyces humicola]MCQ4079154.1 roadblock/LC7 domain-containing protein [Streptomyces humicola]